jgi:HAD superfamily hydrolase (TIGR01509 family)
LSEARLVIFDCDGVLVDTEAISARILAQALTAAGLPTSPEKARHEYLGPRLPEVVARAEARLGRRLGPGWLEGFELQRAEAFRRELTPVPGAARAVERIAGAGVAVCVASQARLEKTRLTLGLTGLARLFPDHAFFSAEQVPRGKPSPDLFLHAARVMGVGPERCVVVEDTAHGVAAAVSAGMRVLGLARGGKTAALRRAGAETFASLDEVPGLLGIV